MRNAVALSLVDQGILSALSLLIGILLIKFGTPEALGHFTLAMAVFFMFFSVKYALVTLPISTQIFGVTPEAQAATLRVVCTFDVVLIAASAIISFLVLAAFGFTAAQVSAAVAMVISGLWRELARSVYISLDRMAACLRMDAAAAGLTIASIAGLWSLAPPEVACLGGLSIGNLLSAVLLGPRLPIALRKAPQSLRDYGAFLPLTRWSFVGGVAAELQARGYVFVVQMLRGAAANGLLQASRIIVSPVDLMGIAGARVMVPRMAAMVRQGALHEAYALTRYNICLMTSFALVYFVVLYLAWGQIEPLLFGDNYPRVGEIVVAWGIFSMAAAQFRCLESLFQAMGRYRDLAILGVANTIGVLALMCVLVLPVPLFTVLVILTAGQVFVIAFLSWFLVAPPVARREALP